MNITLVVGYLAQGGTERQVAYLGSELVRRGHTVRILLVGQRLADEYSVAAGVQVLPLQLTKLRHCLTGWRELRDALRHSDVVYSFLDLANAFCALAKPKTGAPLIWGLRAANTSTGWIPKISMWLCQRLRTRADALIANSQAVQAYYLTQGIGGDGVSVVANGVQFEQAVVVDADGVDRMPSDSNLQRELQSELKLPAESFVALVLARAAPEKRQELGLQLLEQNPALQLVFAGAGVSALPKLWRRQNQVLATPENLERCRFLEHQVDVERLLSGVNVLLSLSSAEGFPNSVLEAMAHEVPVVATAVGGVVELLVDADTGADDYGWLVSLDPEKNLVTGLVQALTLVENGGPDVQLRTQNARQRIESHYSIKRMVDQTESLLVQLANPLRIH